MSLNSWLEGTIVDNRRAPIDHAKIKRKKRQRQMRHAVKKARHKGTGAGRAKRAMRLKWRHEDRRR